MPKLTHETLVQLLRNAPTLIVDLLWPEKQIPASSIHITHAEFVDINLAEYRADDVVLIGEDPKLPIGALISEAQTTIDPIKPKRWPLYVSGLFARHDCPVDLVVLTLDPAVAAWAATTIAAGRLPGAMKLTPTVIGPDRIPWVTDLDEARRSPELAVLSALAHGGEPGAEAIALAALAGSQDLDNTRGTFYPDLVLAHLAPAARVLLEKLMANANYEFQSDFARKYFAEGRAEGKTEGRLEGEAKLLLRLLGLKGIVITESDRQRILSCTDCAQIERWADRILTAQTRDELFASHA